MLRVGVIGYGYWGPNIVRNFSSALGSQVETICDVDQRRLQLAGQRHPGVRLTQSVDEVMNDPRVDMVAIVTPVFSHFELGKKALEAGKSLFMEKPFTGSSREAEALIELADKKRLRIAVDHTFLFHPVVKAIKTYMDEDRLGKIYYYDSTRINLGLFQQDVNVIWDLAPHDFSIMDFILAQRPRAVAAHGMDHFKRNQHDMAYVTVFFDDDLLAHFNFNWLSPVKVRRTLIGGEKRMCVWDDMEVDEKIKLYDKGLTVSSQEGYYKLLVEYRKGDIFCPFIDHTEPLAIEVDYILDAIANNKPILNDGREGLRVVRMLEACDESIRNHGRVVEL